LPKHRKRNKDISLTYVLVPLIFLVVLFAMATLGTGVLFLSIVLLILYLLRNRIARKVGSYVNKISGNNGMNEIPSSTTETSVSVQMSKVQQSDDIYNSNSLLNSVKKTIDEFRPSMRYENELGYHAELVGCLKSKFPSLKMEEQIGSSRPDITIEDIAIEIKGPTGNKALDSLTTKCLKYLQHYPHLLVVLFEPFFNEGHFREIERGLKDKFPNVTIIRKPNYFTYEPTMIQGKNRGWRN
jgi:hypothetical protein